MIERKLYWFNVTESLPVENCKVLIKAKINHVPVEGMLYYKDNKFRHPLQDFTINPFSPDVKLYWAYIPYPIID